MDLDGFSSSLDLMKTVGAFCSNEEPSGAPSGDAEKFYPQKGQKMQKPPLHVVQADGWE